MVNNTVELLKSHRSIRRYTEDQIPQVVLDDILLCAQWAPTSHHVQAYSIIVVKNKELQKQLAQLCSQKFIGTSPVFLIFCADFNRLKLACDLHGARFILGEPEDLIVGAVDTALAAQNVMVAARSYGLGGVMIGGIRNNPEQVCEILKLPRYTMPIMGMCLGYPAEDPWQKPRLPKQVVIHNEIYETALLTPGLEEYEMVSADYYTRRTKGKQTAGWTKRMAEYFQTSRRANIRRFVEKQGLLVKR